MFPSIMRKLLFVSIAIICCFTFAAWRLATVGVPAEKLMDVSYGPYPRNKMDVYLPANRTDHTPFVVLIHGGGWVGYGKEYVRGYQDTLFSHGIAVASINHRYANDSSVHYKDMLEDISNAVRYCIEHSAAWHVRSDQVIMTGYSSGAHLALLYSYMTSTRVAAIVEFSGPVNVGDTSLLNYASTIGLLTLVQKMVGAKYIRDKPVPPLFVDASPVSHVKDIPVLIIHGDADAVVPFAQALQFDQLLKKKGITDKLIVLAGDGHDLMNLKDSTQRALEFGEAIKWIEKYGN